MTEERLRELLHDTVSGATGPDLAETAWRRAQVRRRRQQLIAVGAVVVLAGVGVGGVRLLTPEHDALPTRPAPSSASPTPTASATPGNERGDAAYLGVPVWWAPDLDAPLPTLEDGPLPATIDLATPATDAEEEPIERAVAAYVDTATTSGGADGAVRLVGPDGEQRDLDISGLVSLPVDGIWRVSAASRSMLSPDGRTLAFPQTDHVALFDIRHGTWSEIEVDAGEGLRWAGVGTLFIPSPRNSGGRMVALDGSPVGRANIADVVRPGVDLGDVSLSGPWRASDGTIAQTYVGRRGTVPGPTGVDSDPTYIVVHTADSTRILVLGAFDDTDGWALLADWLDPATLVYESADGGTARVVAWRVATREFSLVSTISGFRTIGHRLVGSYALEG